MCDCPKNEDVLKALVTLRQLCVYHSSETGGCYQCPLGVSGLRTSPECGLLVGYPDDWEIEGQVRWKAFSEK